MSVSPGEAQEASSIDEQIQSMDPLGADELCASLPRINRDGDLPAAVTALRSLLPAARQILGGSPAECIAAMRDLGMFLGSIKRHGIEPLQAVPEAEPILLELGRRTEMIPRDTVFHYIAWNPTGPRERRYTDDPMEHFLMRAVRLSIRAMHRAIPLCQLLSRLPAHSDDFADGARMLATHVKVLEQVIDFTLQNVSPEFFARRMRYYFDSILVAGKEYLGPAAAHVPISLVDLALWASDHVSADYDHFWRESQHYTIASYRRLYRMFERGPSLVTRVFDAHVASPESPVLSICAEALAATMQSLVVFRGRHYRIAREAYAVDLRLYPVGSGGGSVEMLKNILQTTLDTSRMRPVATASLSPVSAPTAGRGGCGVGGVVVHRGGGGGGCPMAAASLPVHVWSIEHGRQQGSGRSGVAVERDPVTRRPAR